jgi:chemotaxis regulatin CheY-phosphate phosphatase CheZ
MMMMKSFKDLTGYVIKPVQRQFSVTLAIRDRFEEAYIEKAKSQKVVTKKA